MFCEKGEASFQKDFKCTHGCEDTSQIERVIKSHVLQIPNYMFC